MQLLCCASSEGGLAPSAGTGADGRNPWPPASAAAALMPVAACYTATHKPTPTGSQPLTTVLPACCAPHCLLSAVCPGRADSWHHLLLQGSRHQRQHRWGSQAGRGTQVWQDPQLHGEATAAAAAVGMMARQPYSCPYACMQGVHRRLYMQGVHRCLTSQSAMASCVWQLSRPHHGFSRAALIAGGAGCWCRSSCKAFIATAVSQPMLPHYAAACWSTLNIEGVLGAVFVLCSCRRQVAFH